MIDLTGKSASRITDLNKIGENDEKEEDEEIEHRKLTTLEKIKRDEMEKNAGWWSKYYASKAKLVTHFSLSLSEKDSFISDLMIFLEISRKSSTKSG